MQFVDTLFIVRLRSNFPANIYWSSRRLEGVFNTSSAWQFFLFQDVLKTSWRCLVRCFQDVFARRLEDLFEDEKLLRWRRVEDVLKTSSRHLSKTSSRCLENVFKTSSRRFWKTSWGLLGQTSWRRISKTNILVFIKTSWRCLLKTYDQGEYIGLDQDVFWRRRRLQDVFKTSSPRRMFVGLLMRRPVIINFFSWQHRT